MREEERKEERRRGRGSLRRSIRSEEIAEEWEIELGARRDSTEKNKNIIYHISHMSCGHVNH